jgi:hypothetical protein
MSDDLTPFERFRTGRDDSPKGQNIVGKDQRIALRASFGWEGLGWRDPYGSRLGLVFGWEGFGMVRSLRLAPRASVWVEGFWDGAMLKTRKNPSDSR